MTEANQQPAPVTPKKRLGWKEKMFGLLILALVLLALAGLFVRYKQHLKDTISPYRPVQGTTSFSYKSLTEQTLKGADGVLDFKKPTDLEKVSESHNPPEIDFAKYSGPNKLLPYVSYLSAAAVPTSSTLDGAQLAAGLSSALAADHQMAMDNLKDYINKHKIAFYNAPVITEPVALALSGVQAWTADFTLNANTVIPKIDHPAGVPQSQYGKNIPTFKTPDYRGKMVVAVGKSTVYYFMFYDLASSGQTNQSFWDIVISSLRVDQ